MKKRFHEFHRKFAILLAIPLLLWALSGILHPLIANWLKPTIARSFIPPKPLSIPTSALSPAKVFADLKVIHQLKVISLQGRTAYLAITPDQTLHYRWTNGEPIPQGPRHHAVELARNYLNDENSPVEEVTIHEEFSSSYSVINRYLPAYRVRLERADGMEVVVDLRTGKLASYDTPSKRLMLRLFSWFHTWSFLGAAQSPLRIGVVALLVCGSLMVAISGMSTALQMKKTASGKASKSKRFHRLLGLATGVIYLMFSLSGLAHLLLKLRNDDSPQWISQQQCEVTTLSTIPIASDLSVTSTSLAIIDGEPYYRLLAKGEQASHSHYIHATSSVHRAEAEEDYVRQLALEFSGYQEEDITAMEPIHQFRSDYGFIFKRLPVWRVSFVGQRYWQYTVDAADSHLSMRSDTPSLIEALIFINLHKWHFLDFAGRETRDWATVVAASSLALLFLSGLWLTIIRLKKIPSR